MVRLLVQFKNSALSASIADVEKSSKEMQDRLKFKCSVRSWKDSAGLLGVSGGQDFACNAGIIALVELPWQVFGLVAPAMASIAGKVCVVLWGIKRLQVLI